MSSPAGREFPAPLVSPKNLRPSPAGGPRFGTVTVAVPSPPGSLRPLRIFLVENRADTLKYLQMHLEQMGHRVQSARTMKEALKTLPDADCEVLISDVGLPDGDGWELLRRVHLSHPVYAIVMSGLGMSAHLARSRDAGYRHHLLKPFVPEDLDAVLEAATHECPVAR